jgi:hypothetical protein
MISSRGGGGASRTTTAVGAQAESTANKLKNSMIIRTLRSMGGQPPGLQQGLS